jgi:hypothetical protein
MNMLTHDWTLCTYHELIRVETLVWPSFDNRYKLIPQGCVPAWQAGQSGDVNFQPLKVI